MSNLKKIGQFLAMVAAFALGACVAPPMQSATPTPTPTTTAMAMAPVATDVVRTTQAPAAVTIEAKKVTTADGKDAIEVTWSDTLPVSMVVRYVGSGKGGSMSLIPVDGATKKVFFANGMKDGFNFKLASGNYLHLECGGNDKTTQPTLRGLAVDCQRLDAAGRNLGGALVVRL